MKKIRLFFSLLAVFGIVTVSTILFSDDIHRAFGANKIYLNDTSFALEVDHYKTLRIKGTSSKATWKSSTSWVASVSSGGRVTAKAPGTTTITAYVDGRKLTSKVTVLYLHKKDVTLKPGDTSTLKVTGTNSTVTWESSDNKIASVSEKGVVTAKAPGTATITANVLGKQLVSKITVMDLDVKDVVLVHGFKIGCVKTLKLNNVKGKVTWSSSNNSVATVTDIGRIYAEGPGTAVITAKVNGIEFTCQVKVLEMSENSYTLKKGETLKLDVLGTNSEIEWASYKKSVATVTDNGTVTAKSEGKATIVGFADGIKVRCFLTVVE